MVLRSIFTHPFSDVVYHPWKKEDAGNQTRDIMYTISLSNPLAPKTATVTETQVRPHVSSVLLFGLFVLAVCVFC